MGKAVLLNFSCTDEQAEIRGEAIAECLDLTPAKQSCGKNYYLTSHGRKTACGLYRTVIQVAYEAKDV